MEKIHISLKNLHPSVYLCSETQERFMWVCPPELTHLIVNHYNTVFDLPNVSTGARASIVGKIRNDGKYIVHNNTEEIVNAKASEVTKGFLYNRPYKKRTTNHQEPDINPNVDYDITLLQLLSHENISSRKPIYEKYDKQVQGRTHIETGTADSGVMSPFNSKKYPKEIREIGIALSTDHNPRYGLIDPYWCGVNAVVESMRNVASVGATPHAITDCLCFGNPEKPHQMWEFVEAVKGINDACINIGLKHSPNHPTPIIAGNVSFYNESKNNAIPPSPIISCLGKIKNINKSIAMSFKNEKSEIIMIGKRKNELGGSAFYSLYNQLGKNIPKPSLKEVKNQIFGITDCIDNELIISCHDISDGGLATTLCEMTFENLIGCETIIDSKISNEAILFSETGGFIIETKKENVNSIKSIFNQYDIDIYNIGYTGGKKIKINNLVNISVLDAKKSWDNGLREKL